MHPWAVVDECKSDNLYPVLDTDCRFDTLINDRPWLHHLQRIWIKKITQQQLFLKVTELWVCQKTLFIGAPQKLKLLTLLTLCRFLLEFALIIIGKM